VLAQETDLFVQSSDLMLLVFKAAVELADQSMCSKNSFLALLSQLRSKEDDLLGKDSLNIGRPFQIVKRRLSKQLLHKIVGFHRILRLEDATSSRRDMRPFWSGRCFVCRSDLETACTHERPFGSLLLSPAPPQFGARIGRCKEIRIYGTDYD